jgi:hypothetical protein
MLLKYEDSRMHVASIHAHKHRLALKDVCMQSSYVYALIVELCPCRATAQHQASSILQSYFPRIRVECRCVRVGSLAAVCAAPVTMHALNNFVHTHINTLTHLADSSCSDNQQIWR